MTTNETYDLDTEILLAANPYRIPTDADLVEAARGCNQYKHKPGCPEAEGGSGAKDKKDIKALQKDFETADQKVRDAISRIYDLQQEKSRIPNKTFSETVDKSNAIKKKQIDIDIKALQKERDEAIEKRDKIARALREQLTEKPSRIKSDSDGGANLLILPTGDVHQVSDNDLKHYKYNTKFSAFHVNKDGTYAGTPEDGLMLGATLDEALNRFPALSDAAKKDVRSFFSANEKNGKLRFFRMKFN